MEKEAEILHLYELHYSDLLILASGDVSIASPEDGERRSLMTRDIMEALGQDGPGLLAVTGVPNSTATRRRLLPLARKLALLNADDRKLILKKHNLGSDVPLKNPERNVSSFARQLCYAQSMEWRQTNQCQTKEEHLKTEQRSPDDLDDEFKSLGDYFAEVGTCMMEIGLCIARVCDRAIGGQELEQSLLESGTAKGRLIHYHSAVDKFVLKEAGSKKGSSRKLNNSGEPRDNYSRNRQSPSEDSALFQSLENLWQQWHYDYGIFTILTAPMFLLQSSIPDSEAKTPFSDEEIPSPSGHTHLQIFDPRNDKVLMVNAPPDSFIIQVGESADIISKGMLRSTLHSVDRTVKLGNLSRETFVVFLQPAWNKTFSLSDYAIRSLGKRTAEPENKILTLKIEDIVPPLSLRLKDGMTFAEFSRETTKQYYGSRGLQPNK